mmetsp:Transcript_20469/g.37344  ORF Transcript_20469/g.37344 Transcript_20469/m.37344 type:complete len:122 (+) Transcript_20469:87-452(+)
MPSGPTWSSRLLLQSWQCSACGCLLMTAACDALFFQVCEPACQALVMRLDGSSLFVTELSANHPEWHLPSTPEETEGWYAAMSADAAASHLQQSERYFIENLSRKTAEYAPISSHATSSDS